MYPVPALRGWNYPDRRRLDFSKRIDITHHRLPSNVNAPKRPSTSTLLEKMLLEARDKSSGEAFSTLQKRLLNKSCSHSAMPLSRGEGAQEQATASAATSLTPTVIVVHTTLELPETHHHCNKRHIPTRKYQRPHFLPQTPKSSFVANSFFSQTAAIASTRTS